MNPTDETILDESNKLTNGYSSVMVTLDWETYFKEFCSAHGKYPVVYGKEDEFLLFPDGWMYSATSYEGPEFQPPKDIGELLQLQLYYWGRRYRIIKREYNDLKNDLVNLESVAREKSLPLYQLNEYQNSEGKTVTESRKLDLTIMQRRIEWLDKDSKNCKTMIDIYAAKLKKQQDTRNPQDV